MKGREKSAMVFNHVWRDILLTAHGGRGGQAGDEGMLKTGITRLGLEPWLSVVGIVRADREEKASGLAWG